MRNCFTLAHVWSANATLLSKEGGFGRVGANSLKCRGSKNKKAPTPLVRKQGAIKTGGIRFQSKAEGRGAQSGRKKFSSLPLRLFAVRTSLGGDVQREGGFGTWNNDWRLSFVTSWGERNDARGKSGKILLVILGRKVRYKRETVAAHYYMFLSLFLLAACPPLFFRAFSPDTKFHFGGEMAEMGEVRKWRESEVWP